VRTRQRKPDSRLFQVLGEAAVEDAQADRLVEAVEAGRPVLPPALEAACLAFRLVHAQGLEAACLASHLVQGRLVQGHLVHGRLVHGRVLEAIRKMHLTHPGVKEAVHQDQVEGVEAVHLGNTWSPARLAQSQTVEACRLVQPETVKLQIAAVPATQVAHLVQAKSAAASLLQAIVKWKRHLHLPHPGIKEAVHLGNTWSPARLAQVQTVEAAHQHRVEDVEADHVAQAEAEVRSKWKRDFLHHPKFREAEAVEADHLLEVVEADQERRAGSRGVSFERAAREKTSRRITAPKPSMKTASAASPFKVSKAALRVSAGTGARKAG